MAGKRKRKTKQRAIGATNLTKQVDQPFASGHSRRRQTQRQCRPSKNAANSQANDATSESTIRPSSTLTLGDHFHSLPMELRLHIFSFLVVQPVKWNLQHKESCAYTKSSAADIVPRIIGYDPSQYHWYRKVTSTDTCVRCMEGQIHRQFPPWRREISSLVVWKNPWRSDWAPKIRNEFVCSDCWDANLRTDSHPHVMEAFRAGVMKCLCARREHLQVRLVCKRWSEEAGRVFYSKNTFAFENTRTFVAFANNLNSHWRALISKISIMAYHSEPQRDSRSTEAQLNRLLGAPEHHKTISALWGPLRSFSALSSLQLDATFLARVDCIQSMLRLGLRNLRQVRFNIRNRPGVYVQVKSGGSKYIYPEYVQSRVLVGGLAEVVSRAIKGQRSAWLKRKECIVEAAVRERELLAGLLSTGPQTLPPDVFSLRRRKRWSDRLDDGTVMVYYDEEIEEWKRLWDKFGGAKMPLHAYLPTAHHPPEVRWKPKKMDREIPIVKTVEISHEGDGLSELMTIHVE